MQCADPGGALIAKSFEGVVSATPFPRLLVDRPESDSRSSYLLVSTGKFGAQDVAREHDGKRVRLDGTLVYNGAATMLELVDGSIEVLGDATGMPPADERLGTRELVGEIVDSKCWLGVMQPGRLKTHRSCAIRCIAGGIPPLFVVTTYGDAVEALVLVGADGRAINDEILDLVGENQRVTGDVFRSGDLLVLAAEPEAFAPVN